TLKMLGVSLYSGGSLTVSRAQNSFGAEDKGHDERMQRMLSNSLPAFQTVLHASHMATAQDNGNSAELDTEGRGVVPVERLRHHSCERSAGRQYHYNHSRLLPEQKRSPQGSFLHPAPRLKAVQACRSDPGQNGDWYCWTKPVSNWSCLLQELARALPSPFAPDSDQAALPALAHHKSVPLHRSKSPLRLVQRPLYERQLDPDNWPIVHDWLNAPSLPDSNLGHFAYSDPLRQPIAHPPPPVCPTKPPSSRG